MKIKTTRIDWDTSFGEVGYPNRLPQQVIFEIDEPLELAQDKIIDQLGDAYGWCIHSLDYEIMSL